MPVYIPQDVEQVVVRSMITEQQVREILQRAARNRDGCLSKEELKKALKEIGSRMPAFGAHRFLRIADTNHDGQICGNAEFDKLVSCILNCYA